MPLPIGVSGDGDAYHLLTQVEARLRAQVRLDGSTILSESNCFITDQPVPEDAYFAQGKMAVTVCLGDGVFNESNYDGGGANCLTEDADLLVTVFIRSKVDQPPRAKIALLDEERGLFRKLKPAVLQALLVDDPTQQILRPWHPLKNGVPFLRGAIFPRRSTGPRQLGGLDWLGLTLSFGAEFDWNLGQLR